MHKRTSILISLFFIICVFFGCATKIVIKTELDQLFEKNFEGFVPSEATWIKEGASKDFPYTTYDEVWDATTLLLMQQGIIVRSSKEHGVIIAISRSSLAVFIENKGPIITVYLNQMHDLYKWVGRPEIAGAEASSEDTTKIFFGKLSTQIYACQKWAYLNLPAAENGHESQEVFNEKVAAEEVSQKEILNDSGIIIIASDPPGAKVFIDGEYKGQTPIEILLAAGTYQLFLEHQPYKPYMDSLAIEIGQTNTLNIQLQVEKNE